MNKGFTLIELLAVIVILSVIALITTLATNNIIKDSKNSLTETQEKSIENAAKVYYIKEGMQINDNCISVQELIDKGYIEGSEVKNPSSEENMTGSVKITFEANQYKYDYQTNSCE